MNLRNASKAASKLKQYLPEDHWWKGRDIQAEINALPVDYWKKNRDFIGEGYVPITRQEYDDLFAKELDKFVGLVGMRGPTESIGTEGVFLRPPFYLGPNGVKNHPYYKGMNYDGTMYENKEMFDLYNKAKERYLQDAAGKTSRETGRITANLRTLAPIAAGLGASLYSPQAAQAKWKKSMAEEEALQSPILDPVNMAIAGITAGGTLTMRAAQAALDPVISYVLDKIGGD